MFGECNRITVYNSHCTAVDGPHWLRCRIPMILLLRSDRNCGCGMRTSHHWHQMETGNKSSPSKKNKYHTLCEETRAIIGTSFLFVLRAYWTARHEWKTSANIFLLQIFIPVEMKRYWCSECKSIWIYQMGRVWFIDVPFVVCAVRPPLVANGECSFSAAIIGIVQYGMWTTPLPVRSAYTLKGIQVMQCVPVWPIFARNPFPLKSPLNDRKVRVGPQFWDNNNNNK